MCSECWYSKCPSGCPNADDPKIEIVYHCAECGNEVFEGDIGYKAGNLKFCYNCIIEITAEKEN